jgi:O-antigen ligase
MTAGRVTRLMPYLPNASISVLSLMFWPALLVASRLGWLRRYRWGVLIASAVAAVTVFASEHATSQLAFAGAAVAFVLFLARPQLARRLTVAGWVAATLFVVPLITLPYSLDGHRATWLPESWRHRIVIWSYTSEQVADAPIFGAGIAAARAMNETRDPDGPRVPGTRFQPGTSLHSHNAYLQVWYETGAVGALMLLALGLLILRALTRFPEAIQPYLAATFVACALSAVSGYSIWAAWYMASVAMVCIFAALGTALPANSDGTVGAPAPVRG